MSWNKPEMGKTYVFSKWLFPQEPDPKAYGSLESVRPDANSKLNPTRQPQSSGLGV